MVGVVHELLLSEVDSGCGNDQDVPIVETERDGDEEAAVAGSLRECDGSVRISPADHDNSRVSLRVHSSRRHR